MITAARFEEKRRWGIEFDLIIDTRDDSDERLKVIFFEQSAIITNNSR